MGIKVRTDRKSIVFATISGMIGVVSEIPLDIHNALQKLQLALSKVVSNVGNLNYENWRSFKNEYKSNPSEYFIDGDMCERFLDLSEDEKERLIEKLKGDGFVYGRVEITLLIEKLNAMEDL